MYDQTARIMFNSVISEVVKYFNNPSSNGNLGDRLRNLFSYPNETSVEESSLKYGLANIDISFFMDESKEKEVSVKVFGERRRGDVGKFMIEQRYLMKMKYQKIEKEDFLG